MAAAEEYFELEPPMQEQSVLESNVNTIQKDVAELKADVKRLDASLAGHRLETEKSFSALRVEMKDSITSLRDEMRASIAALRIEMMASFAKLRSSVLSHIAWMISTLIAAAGVAFAMVKVLRTP